MKIFYLYLLGALFSIGVKAQDYSSYYSKINSGKQSIIDQDYKQAVQAYLEAFESHDFAFARDCWHAVELASFINDTIHLQKFLGRSIRQGIKLNVFESKGLTDQYIGQPFYQKIKENEEFWYNAYLSKINLELRNEINLMFDKDQELRKKFYDANIFTKLRFKKKWKNLNASQVDRLIEITKEFGFPGEQLIGLDIEEHHTKVNTNNLSCGMPIVIFLHHYSHPNPSYDSLLLKEVEKGFLYNEHFASICDFEAKYGKNKYASIGYFGVRFLPKYADKSKVEKRRNQIGLMTIQEVEGLNVLKLLTPFWKRLY